MPDASESIAELVDLQRTGATSAEQLVTERIAAIEAAAELRAIVQLDAEGALAAARALDAHRIAGKPLGPLHGVPVTIKTSFAAAGLRASVGTPDSEVAPSTDAPSVARLRTAGAVLLGTTNVPSGLDGYFSDSPLGGRTANPWDASRTPGGSSGGSAAAVAAGLSWGDLGSDLTGSIRVPAAFCGVFGHRPSQGAISKRAHLPWPLETLLDPPVSAAGPLARTAADLALLVEVLLRDDPEATTVAPATVTDLAGLRVGVWREEPDAACDPEVDAVIDVFLRTLGTTGAQLLPIADTVLGSPESAALFDRLVSVELALTSTEGAPVSDALRDWDAQRRVRMEWARTVEHVDVVIAPVVPVVAPLHGALQADPALAQRIGRWSCMANLAAVPCTVVPVGLAAESGMPVAVQVIAPFGRDRDALAVARLLEEQGVVTPLRAGSAVR